MILWDPEILSRIRHLHLVATRTVEGLLHGTHRSHRVGANIEFADYKEYAPGDSLRDLDWKVLARADRLVVRRYQVETELSSVLVLDASGDLATGEAGPDAPLPELSGSKFGYALVLTATLVWYLHKHQEPVGLAIVGGEGVPERFIPPRSSASHVARIFGALAQVRPGGRAGLGEALAALGPRMRRRSLVILVSDFMEEPAEWVPALSAMARRRTDLVALHVMDRRELSLDFEQPAIFYSPEGGEPLPVDPVGVADEFNAVLRDWWVEVREGVAGHRGRYYPCWTHLPMELSLRLLIMGARVPADDRVPA
ncbi:MAG: DUF58 domain-containing protein [Alphaproteobacteria bacterium]|nr:DUF58 domain-containing protein [Alphaproteobacteria bacterium]